ncbi:GNAT family N-acetyltransferase [Enterobacter sp. RHBSTW-00994]|uniref:GNAT family N-acetyltransferase n=1 Tax=Lelliottia sp. RWM.1 TaxID=2663242 RepID=UPI0015EAECA2|nr:GNAT family N-acetyltransferase [Lelliottia sp. RWM.1]QLR42080.1 GNAT family N-acetyltransferase [Enterobacter sp. RHBSTW-00994]
MILKIRPAMPEDVPGLFAVRTSVTENAMTYEEMQALGITEATVCSMIEASECAWVATENQHVVGFSMILPEDGCLFAAFVLPHYEGQGLGKKLVHAAEQALFRDNPLIWLETGKNTRAAGFYRRLGWKHAQDVGEGDIRLEKSRQEQ